MTIELFQAGRALGGDAVGHSNAQDFRAVGAAEGRAGPSGERAVEGNANPEETLGCGLESYLNAT